MTRVIANADGRSGGVESEVKRGGRVNMVELLRVSEKGGNFEGPCSSLLLLL